MKLQKIASLVLAILMIFSLGITAFADDTVTPTEANGSITINGVTLKDEKPVATYSIYKLLDLESYNVTSGAYSYKVNAAWADFFETEEALKYVAIDEAGYVTWIGGEDDDTVAAFAKIALAYAQDESHPISPVKSSENEGEFVVLPQAEGTTSRSGKFENLELGWYLVDSNVGALCGLTTTNPAASITAKNGAPTIDKQVLEDSTNQWGDTNTADIGQIVDFRVTINVHAGAQNYVLHDTMSKGLTFKGVTGIVHIVPSATENKETTVPEEYYTVVKAEEGKYLEDGCTFEVRFTKEFCDHLETNNKVVVSYQAMINRNAIVATDGNFNKAKLEYGDTFYTTEDSTYSKTYGIEIVKTDSQNTLIDGAQFRIYDAATEGNEVKVVPYDGEDVSLKGAYRRARADENGVPIVVTDGIVKVIGFDNGTYYLEETVAPAGYNKLTARQRFIISDGNLYATFNGDVFSTGSGVHVINKTGSMLPETGGMGTTLFYVLGGLLVGGAVVALVSKKRMSVK